MGSGEVSQFCAGWSTPETQARQAMAPAGRPSLSVMGLGRERVVTTKGRAGFPGVHGQCGGEEQGGPALPHLIQRVLLCLSGCRAAWRLPLFCPFPPPEPGGRQGRTGLAPESCGSSERPFWQRVCPGGGGSKLPLWTFSSNWTVTHPEQRRDHRINRKGQRFDPDDGELLCGTEQSSAWRRVVATKEIETQWVGEMASP